MSDIPPTTLFEKIWAAHEVAPGLIYIDLHLVHEVTSPQAFDGLRLAGRTVRRPDRTLATADHNVPTDGTPTVAKIRDQLSRVQVETLERNCEEFGVPGLLARQRAPGHRPRHRPRARRHPAGHDDRLRRQPHRDARRVRRARVRHRHERGRARPRDAVPRRSPSRSRCASATTAESAPASPPRTSSSPRSARWASTARPATSSSSPADDRGALDGGPHDGLQHDDRGRRPRGHDRAGRDDLRLGPRARADEVQDDWRELRTDEGATFDKEITVDAAAISPQVTWGTTPEMVVGVADVVPEPRTDGDERALAYMDLEPGTPIQEIKLDRVFIGSCTNSRIGDLRAAAEVVQGRKVAPSVSAMVVPGSAQVKAQAEAGGPRRGLPRGRLRLARRGLLDVPGHEPRHAEPGERCASTSNRNFEGRQGRGARTHLVSPEWRPRPRSRATSSTSDRTPWRAHGADRDDHGRVSVLTRDDVDTDQIIPKQFLKRVERTGFGEYLFYDWAKEPDWDLAGQPDPRRRPELRLRLQPRARAVGPGGLRVQARSSRRPSPTSSSRTARRSGCCRCADRGGGRGSTSPEPSARSTSPRRRSGGRAGLRTSTSTRTSSTGCSTASTTSARRCSRARRSTRSRATASAAGRSPRRWREHAGLGRATYDRVSAPQLLVRGDPRPPRAARRRGRPRRRCGIWSSHRRCSSSACRRDG